MAGLGQGIKIDLINKCFGHLIVIKQGIPKKSNRSNKMYDTWECLCDCGKTVVITGKQLTRGQKSCGCHKLDGIFRKESSDEDINIKKVINSYKTKKKKCTQIWNLSFDEAKALFLAPCFYCGTKPNRQVRAYDNVGPSIIGGIDRIDSSKGYLSDNVVPCCKICNRAKMDISQSDFIEYLDNLTRYRNK